MTGQAHRLTSLLSFISLNSPQLPDLKRVHALLIVSGAITPKPIARCLVSLYCLRSIEDAVLLHSQLSQQVYPIGCRPSKCTFPLLITAAKLSKSTNHGKLLHGLAVKIGFMYHAPVPNSLIHMYAFMDAFNHARQVFDEMPHRDIVSHNTLLSGYVKIGDLEKAENLFGSMPEDNVISWAILFKGYVRKQQFEKGFAFFSQMLMLGLIPDQRCILTVLSVITHFKLVPYGKMVHGFVIKRWLKLTERVRIALINFYCKCGNPDSAFFLFEETRKKDVSIWNTLISAISSFGLVKEALELFTSMQVNGVKPNEDTFICLLLICGHAGLVEEGLEYFEMMNSVYGMKPTLAHNWCLVDILVRAGRSEDALKTVQCLPWDNRSYLWDALICLSKTSSDISIGEYLGRKMIELEPDNRMRYVPLLNLYAAASRWDKYWMVMNEMKQREMNQLSDYRCSQFV